MRPSVQGVDPPVCCVLDVTVTYARDSFVDCQAGPFVLSRGGPGILDVTVTCARDSFVDSQAGPFVLSRGGGGRYPGTSLTVSALKNTYRSTPNVYREYRSGLRTQP